MNQKCFRFVSGSRGIYEAVALACLADDPRRASKPDGSWLQRTGPKFPGSISFWTAEGLNKYFECGLLEWHLSVVPNSVEVIVAEKIRPVQYEDEYQLISMPEDFRLLESLNNSDFQTRYLQALRGR